MFQPDFRILSQAARNIQTKRFPLYEHIIDAKVMEAILGKRFADLYHGDDRDLDEYFRHYCSFFLQMGFDTVSFEELIGPAMPGSGALGQHVKGAIADRADFDRYPWEGICDTYFTMYRKRFEALRRNLPAGMKAVGGAGYGVFECVQDLVGYEALCYIRVDDPDLYAGLFARVGETNLKIWSRLLAEFGDIFCVCRFGDDLGYKSNTLLPVEDIQTLIIPAYRPIIAAIHAHDKPFLWHSCGCIFAVMEDMINIARIDAKHSNEDQIAPFTDWVDKYGERIGNFGGIDTDAVCRLSQPDMKAYIQDVIRKSVGHGGFAFGSGNSIPDFVPPESFLFMNQTARAMRAE